MKKTILLLNGPNLNLLGTREPHTYGSMSLSDINSELQARFLDKLDLRFKQSNHEGELIDAIHNARLWADGICINAGAYTHTSIALHDAITSVDLPCVEVHLSNIYAREDFRRQSLIAPATIGQVTGFGWYSYALALDALINWQKKSPLMKS